MGFGSFCQILISQTGEMQNTLLCLALVPMVCLWICVHTTIAIRHRLHTKNERAMVKGGGGEANTIDQFRNKMSEFFFWLMLWWYIWYLHLQPHFFFPAKKVPS